ncbi:hypothetical protein AM1_6157 [Acaryochloris marina MBIC11017]|uniref:Uncharacterized protein n=1 Tax=Acaryochloris marina (strain MBIC 11017) TaxID=329726 RepID=B0C4V1_ACAM1|nr:hypothetical protein AM1_6157 [Acaryochloris marina MBIC11017]
MRLYLRPLSRFRGSDFGGGVGDCGFCDRAIDTNPRYRIY